MKVVEGYQEIGQHCLYYQKLKPETNRKDLVLVFLHDSIGSVSQWKKFPFDLSQQLQLEAVVFDRSGHGKSSSIDLKKRTPQYMHEYAKESAELLDQLYPEKNWVLFGHSDGGSIALILASQFPDKVKMIFSLAAHVVVEEITLQGIKETRDEFISSGKLEKLKKHQGENAETIFRGWHETWLSKEFRDWNLIEECKNIWCPLLLIQGEEDNYGTEDQVDLIMQNVKGPVVKVLLDNCGHAPHKTFPETIARLCKRFLDNYPIE